MTKKLVHRQTTCAESCEGRCAHVHKSDFAKTNSDQNPRSFEAERSAQRSTKNPSHLEESYDRRSGVPQSFGAQVKSVSNQASLPSSKSFGLDLFPLPFSSNNIFSQQAQFSKQGLEEASATNRSYDLHKLIASEVWGELPTPTKQLITDRYRRSIEMASYHGTGVSRILDINTFPPFLTPLAGKQPCHWGVIKITNIPYSVTIQEIGHFIGRLSRTPLLTPHIHGFPIHIVIERPTGKTLEVFVEFHTFEDAHACVLRVENSVLRGKPLKIGQRHVGVEMSDQGELMSMLFPRAKCVAWDPSTGTPHVKDNDDQFSEGFRGFFTVEEMASIVKHAETPQRSPFSARCMQRTYESMISTLYKFPWLSADRYTVAARDFIFTSYMAQLRVLVSKVAPTDDMVPSYGGRGSGSMDREVGLNHNLLMDFLFAGLNAVCFSMRQKWQITVNCGPLGSGFPLSQHAFAWPFQCLVPAHNAPDMVLEFWLNILVDGFEMAFDNRLTHGFEKYIKIQRDDSGFTLVEFTQAGHGLHFQDAIILEQTLMAQMVEKGRMRWCVENQVPYETLNVAQFVPKFNNEDLMDAFGELHMNESEDNGLESTEQDNISKRSANQRRGHNESSIDDKRPIRSEAFGSQFDAIDRALELFENGGFPTKHQLRPDAGPGHLTYVRRSPRKGPKNFTIDPRTPEFVPSQAWSGIKQPNAEDDVFGNDDTLGRPASTAFHNPFTRQPIPQPLPIRKSCSQSPVRGEGSTGSADSETTLVSNTYGQSPARSRSVSDRAVEKHFGLISTASRSQARRKTITVDTTIDEEVEGTHHDHTGGVHLKSYSEDLRSSARHNY